ncbi:MAG: hypothetical protein BWX67_02283 [Thermotogae bacterium ADurb.Bin062]|nr:MAG: hypothetical protein BWX67_02294 [Thermotogota bacterium ADurb.Bin062]OQC28426.1 MAG: hypothetical protein BWX67_02283 [Thermotogota bacterium ADurb.Bin062]
MRATVSYDTRPPPSALVIVAPHIFAFAIKSSCVIPSSRRRFLTPLRIKPISSGSTPSRMYLLTGVCFSDNPSTAPIATYLPNVSNSWPTFMRVGNIIPPCKCPRQGRALGLLCVAWRENFFLVPGISRDPGRSDPDQQREPDRITSRFEVFIF